MKTLFSLGVLAVVSAELRGTFGRYPGFTGCDQASGSVTVTSEAAGAITVKWNFTGVAANQTSGIHIHSGVTCSDHVRVQGHYYDAASFAKDPWDAVTYTADADGTAVGEATIIPGVDFESLPGRAVVIHVGSKRVGCGSLGPSYAAEFDTGGSLAIVGETNADLTVMYAFTGLDKGSSGQVKLYDGDSCDNLGSVIASAGYETNTAGASNGFAVLEGEVADYQTAKLKPIVLENKGGAVVGCALFDCSGSTAEDADTGHCIDERAFTKTDIVVGNFFSLVPRLEFSMDIGNGAANHGMSVNSKTVSLFEYCAAPGTEAQLFKVRAFYFEAGQTSQIFLEHEFTPETSAHVVYVADRQFERVARDDSWMLDSFAASEGSAADVINLGVETGTATFKVMENGVATSSADVPFAGHGTVTLPSDENSLITISVRKGSSAVWAKAYIFGPETPHTFFFLHGWDKKAEQIGQFNYAAQTLDVLSFPDQPTQDNSKINEGNGPLPIDYSDSAASALAVPFSAIIACALL